ncbi:hypothetical protein DEIPH_ctg002orf0078 [Deinococcus phoenicis]|uniref:Uncharacterized protein n=1 Tax=Deinococcus phoenicis TaxID=1476583 RepID=A0A016QUE7_9DEIO|nr:hypothetical protein [Deinococcus phoenicis]EYB69750.1 hypothetical protein DEIPH_ctg002orf0078 [Deinococcus phoenicis]
MSEDKPQPPQDRSPQGGAKDTDDLSDIKDVQRPGMAEKARQVEQTPKDVTGEHDALQPQNQRR